MSPATYGKKDEKEDATPSRDDDRCRLPRGVETVVRCGSKRPSETRAIELARWLVRRGTWGYVWGLISAGETL